MKYIKLFESFLVENIRSICKINNISNYTINDDGSIDVEGDVILIGEKLNKIPLKFNKVNGDFRCNVNNLTSLEGCPNYIGGDFFCNANKINSLKYGPEYVGGSYMCQNNNLSSFEGVANYIGEHFWCDDNNIKTFDFFPEEIGKSFNCYRNPIREILLLLESESILEYSIESTISNLKELNEYDIFRDDGDSIVLDRLNEFLIDTNRPTIKFLKNYNLI